VLTNCITTTNPYAHNPSASFGQKDTPFTYSKTQVIRLMSQIPQKHFPRRRSSQQGKTWTSLHVCFSLVTADKQQPSSSDVRAIRSRASGTRHRTRHSTTRHRLALNGGRHAWATTTKLMRFFFDFLSETKVSVSETKLQFFKGNMFSFRKHMRNESVFETKIKLFLFLKRKDFNLQTKVKVFPKRK